MEERNIGRVWLDKDSASFEGLVSFCTLVMTKKALCVPAFVGTVE